MTNAQSERRPPSLVDGHVHFHPRFDAVRFLNGARARFRHAAGALGFPPDVTGALLFADPAGADGFGVLRATTGDLSRAGWSLSETGEAGSVIARREGEGELVLIAGRQIACREGIEILAPGRTAPYPDGAPILDALRDIRGEDALAVLPWGFGKWWGRRGRIVESVIDTESPKHIFLCDSCLRPRGGRRPAIFRRAEERGFRVLSGTDPLPFRSMTTVAGRCGFVVDATLLPEAPMTSIRAALRATREVATYGEGDRWFRFALVQAAMQFRNRRGRGTG